MKLYREASESARAVALALAAGGSAAAYELVSWGMLKDAFVVGLGSFGLVYVVLRHGR